MLQIDSEFLHRNDFDVMNHSAPLKVFTSRLMTLVVEALFFFLSPF